MQKKTIISTIALVLLILIASIVIAYPLTNRHAEASIEEQVEGRANASSVTQVNVDLTKEGGIFIIPTNTGSVIEKNASAVFSGTIDETNHVILEGTIILDEEEENVKLLGDAYKVFVGWNVPEGAKPIYTEVGNTTMTRYEGATKKYATYVDVSDESEKYTLHGEFADDGSGGFIGFVYLDGKECQIGLRGSSMSMYENVTSDDKNTDEYE